MSAPHTVTIDRTGRLVVPKALRDEFGVGAGHPMVAVVRDGLLEIAPSRSPSSWSTATASWCWFPTSMSHR